MNKKRKTKKQKQNAHSLRVIASLCLVALLFAGIWYFSDPSGAKNVFSNLTLLIDRIKAEAPSQGSPFPQPSAMPEGPFMDVYILDVGQGDSIFIKSPSGKTMLIDTGESEYVLRVNSFLKQLGVSHIDVLIATHPHSDHIGGMRRIIEAYDVGAFYTSDTEHTTSAYEGMLAALEDKGVTLTKLWAGAGVNIPWDDNVEIDVLSPYKHCSFSDLNDMSLVLRLKYGNTAILLTGDAGFAAEELALNMASPSSFAADVLKVGHHGSSDATSAEFFNAVSPEIAVISCGRDNDFGHPAPSLLEFFQNNGVKYYRTDENGTVRLLFTGKNVISAVQK
ncbi:MAG: MBL fold metallo-hydrolase [Clostridia bacterium]